MPVTYIEMQDGNPVHSIQTNLCSYPKKLYWQIGQPDAKKLQLCGHMEAFSSSMQHVIY